jgi:hypothetical protein
MKKTFFAAVLTLAALPRVASAQELSEPAALAGVRAGEASVKATGAGADPASVFTTRELMNKHRADLEALYKTLGPGEIPDGESDGIASSDPGTVAGRVSEIVLGAFWKGKIFDRAHGELINRLVTGHAVKAKVFIGPSWLDGKPSVIIDYKDTSDVAGFIRDEIRETSPGIYYGFAYERGKDGAAPRADIVFALDFNAPRARAAAPAGEPHE